jgi:hypothetical protein
MKSECAKSVLTIFSGYVSLIMVFSVERWSSHMLIAIDLFKCSLPRYSKNVYLETEAIGK